MSKKFINTKKRLQLFLVAACLTISLLFINQPMAGNVTYVYDELYRLIQVTYNDGSTITYTYYTYDSVGNRLAENITTSPETISTPSTPSGPTSGITGVSYDYSTNGAISSLNHTVEYQFDWKGDGTDLSSWGSGTQSKTWTNPGTYNVKARARCSTHSSVISSWSEALSVQINPLYLFSIGADDGWVKESLAGSGVGGSKGTSPLYVGDDVSNRQYKTIVSFNTSGIPSNAIIQSATLKLKRRGMAGTNPFTTHGSCYVDVVRGTFGAQALENSDFQASATASQVATMSNPTVNGAISTGSLNASGLDAINKGGITQMRVYFSLPSNNNGIADNISFYSGDDVTPSNRPVLEVEYIL